MELSKNTKARLKDRYGSWAVVTGASSGIGKEIASQLGSSGLNLLLVARRNELLEALAAEIRTRHNVQVITVSTDLSTPEGIATVEAQTESLPVGLLVAAAGFGTSGNFLDAKVEDEVDMIRLNCEALFRQTHHFAQRFAEQGRGGIVLLSSMVGFQGVPYAAHYAATKAYVQSLGEALHVELKSKGVDVLAAAPGPVSSGFSQRANMQMDMSMKPSDVGVPILQALGHKGTILPGFLTKFLVYSLRTVPRWGKIRMMQLVMGGMTKHQRALN